MMETISRLDLINTSSTSLMASKQHRVSLEIIPSFCFARIYKLVLENC